MPKTVCASKSPVFRQQDSQAADDAGLGARRKEERRNAGSGCAAIVHVEREALQRAAFEY